VIGKIDGALDLDGRGDYVNCGNLPTLQIRDAITLACWIKVAQFTRNWETILAKGNDSYRLSRSAETGNAVHMGINGTTAEPYSWFDGTIIVTDDQWHHVAGVYDGAHAMIYVDGVLDTTISATGQINDSDYNLYIGENAQASGRNLNGLVDDVRIYSRALSQEEIQIVMEGGEKPGLASEPNPANDATDVCRDVVLSWTPGEYAATHDVYFGTVFEDVNEASRENDPNAVLVSQNQDDNMYDPFGFAQDGPNGLLEFETTYYWRIDEINDAYPNSPWKGNTWSFTTRNYIVVDDFEDYNDYEPDSIFDTWMDGWLGRL